MHICHIRLLFLNEPHLYGSHGYGIIQNGCLLELAYIRRHGHFAADEGNILHIYAEDTFALLA